MTTDSDLSYQPGDHVGVYAGNDPAIVDAVLDRLTPDAPDPDQVTKMEILKEKHTPLGEWIGYLMFSSSVIGCLLVIL